MYRRALVSTAVASAVSTFILKKSAIHKPVLADDSKHKTYATRGTVTDFRRHYRMSEKLGEGTFAIVRKGVDLSTKEAVAIKEIDKEKSCEEARENEVKIMEKIGHHPNLIAMHNVYETDDFLLLVQDLAEGGELFDRIVKSGELSEHDAAKLFGDAVKAVKYLHDLHIAHLDIKPENLLLKKVPKSSVSLLKSKHHKTMVKESELEEVVALADFGLAIESSNDDFDLCVGTPAYWAPEMVRRERFGLPVDIWALGCVLYILLTGMHPFDPTGDAPEAQILARVATGIYDQSSKDYKALSDAAKDLIRHLLDPDPTKRYTAKQILEHPWLTTELSQEPIRSNNVAKLRGYRLLTLIKTGMRDMLHNAEDDLFSALDINKDGQISKEELVIGMKNIGLNVTEEEIDDFLELVDTDGDSFISKEEFKEIMSKKIDEGPFSQNYSSHSATLEDLSILFNAFDKNGDGYISADDVHHVLCLLGSTASRSLVQDEWSQVSEDLDVLVVFLLFCLSASIKQTLWRIRGS